MDIGSPKQHLSGRQPSSTFGTNHLISDNVFTNQEGVTEVYNFTHQFMMSTGGITGGGTFAGDMALDAKLRKIQSTVQIIEETKSHLLHKNPSTDIKQCSFGNAGQVNHGAFNDSLNLDIDREKGGEAAEERDDLTFAGGSDQ